jgi:hypothetical protein
VWTGDTRDTRPEAVMAEGLLDHLVGSGKQRWRRSEAERLGRLEAMTTSNWIRLTAWGSAYRAG